ncbi:MAG: hypothetical protein FWF56_04715 [Firmicutes bacterium]|nr:hypothetical protein [Bacillota bacterium]
MRGKDIKKGTYQYKDLHIIAYFPVKKYNIEDYPAVDNYLQQAKWSNKVPDGFGKLMLEQSGKSHIVEGIKFKSRKFTHNKWFEVQDSISYWDDFNKQKIVYSEIVQTPQFYLDKDNKFMVDATAYIMVGNKIEYLIDWLNSKTMGWAFKRWYTVNLGDKGFRYQKQFIQKLPIPLPKNDKTNFSESDIHQILSLTEEEINFIQNTLQ